MVLTAASIYIAMNEGRLIYVMGPSGVGKNAIIASAREKLNKNNNLYFTPRYVTRVVRDGDDDFAISRAAFASYCRQGIFALDWQAHDICYGIGMIINNLMCVGKSVVVNGSRAYLATAQARYPSLQAVMITAPATVVRARLQARAREDAAAISARLARAPQIALPAAQIVTIDNSGPLEHATQALIKVLSAAAGGSVHGA